MPLCPPLNCCFVTSWRQSVLLRELQLLCSHYNSSFEGLSSSLQQRNASKSSAKHIINDLPGSRQRSQTYVQQTLRREKLLPAINGTCPSLCMIADRCTTPCYIFSPKGSNVNAAESLELWLIIHYKHATQVHFHCCWFAVTIKAHSTNKGKDCFPIVNMEDHLWKPLQKLGEMWGYFAYATFSGWG